MPKTVTSLISIVSGLALLIAPCTAETREIVDMEGHKVRAPEKITRVYGSSPPVTSILYAMDPSLVAGWNTPLKKEDMIFLPERMRKLPVIGGWYGQGQSANMEILAKVNPDLVLVSTGDGPAASDKSEEALKRAHRKVVHICTRDMHRYADTFRFLGRLLKKEKRGQKLAHYAEQSLTGVQRTVAGIPEGKKVRVYYAEGVDGLSTDCDKSAHAQLINYAGGMNVYHCLQKSGFGMEKTTMEQVLAWDPQVILAQENAFHERVYSDPRWKNVRAVRDRKVYLIPKLPFNWFDRPPSYMRLLGIKWLANILYPERVRMDMVKETREFYRLFLHADLSDSQIRKILNR